VADFTNDRGTFAEAIPGDGDARAAALALGLLVIGGFVGLHNFHLGRQGLGAAQAGLFGLGVAYGGAVFGAAVGGLCAAILIAWLFIEFCHLAMEAVA